MYLKSLSIGLRWVSWNILKSSDQNANSVVGSHHNWLLGTFNQIMYSESSLLSDLQFVLCVVVILAEKSPYAFTHTVRL